MWLMLMAGLTVPGVGAQGRGDFVKTIRGIVRSLTGEPVPRARVFIYSPQATEIRTLRTDEDGEYMIRGLPGNVDYEVRATFGEIESETRLISYFLQREDNIVNFTLDLIVERESVDDGGPSFDAFDGLSIRGSFALPDGAQAPIPVALLLHGFGESRTVWDALNERLLAEGWAVLAIDLRGHGQSRVNGQGAVVTAVEFWRSDPQQFPLDVRAALDWLKTRPRLDSDRIVVMGSDVGANLALMAGGQFGEVASVIALNPNLDEALSLAGTAREFAPRAAYIVVEESETGERVREYVTGPSRLRVLDPPPPSIHTAVWLGDSDVLDEIVRWLRDTY